MTAADTRRQDLLDLAAHFEDDPTGATHAAAGIVGRDPNRVVDALADLAAAVRDYAGVHDGSVDPASLLDEPGRDPFAAGVADAEGRREDALVRLLGGAS